jgi:hypothetical protein
VDFLAYLRRRSEYRGARSGPQAVSGLRDERLVICHYAIIA